MWEKVCKDRFDKMEDLHGQTLRLLRGHNGTPGLVDDMRTIKGSYRLIRGAVVFVLGAVSLQAVHTLWSWLTMGIGKQ